jgi:hypothetical protein
MYPISTSSWNCKESKRDRYSAIHSLNSVLCHLKILTGGESCSLQSIQDTISWILIRKSSKLQEILTEDLVLRLQNLKKNAEEGVTEVQRDCYL